MAPLPDPITGGSDRNAGGGAAAARVPVVQLDRRVEGVDTDHVDTDNPGGISEAVAHLVGLGRRRVAFAGARPSSSVARERLEASRAALHEHDLEPVVELFGDFSLEWGRKVSARLAASSPLPDAVVCPNDLIALGVVRGLQASGLQVPADVAVTGFDDIGFAAVSEPPLTTVHQPLGRLGHAAVRLLSRRIAGGEAPPEHVRVPPWLVTRGSTNARGGPRP